MGMFDYVNFEMPCPTCGAIIANFQSKDGACELAHIQPYTVSNFYGDCLCGTGVTFSRPESSDGPRTLSINDLQALGFELYVFRIQRPEWQTRVHGEAEIK